MSTSSGREKFCSRCDHHMNEHAKTRDSKCKKCKKGFDICQAPPHGKWAICYVPCECGPRHYPDKARAAKLLEPHEYVQGHPGYRPLEQDNADVTESEDLSEYASVTHAAQDNTAWSQPYGSFTDQDLNRSAPATAPPVAGPSSLGHQRTFSNTSDDPLQWSDERIKQETSVASLTQQFYQTQLDDNLVDAATPVAGPSSLGHQRTFSNTTDDPLQWTEERIAEETSLASLTQQLNQTQLDDNFVEQTPLDDNFVDAETSTFVGKHTLKNHHIYFTNADGNKSKVHEKEWREGKVYYKGVEVACLTFRAPSGNCYYMWLPKRKGGHK